jgi:hypothetical protein
MIARILLFLLVFVATVIANFPYDRAIADRVARLENRTGIQVDYTPVKASVAGVEWRDVRLTTRAGIQIGFEQARLRPSWTGMSAYATQGKGQGRLVMGPSGDLSVRTDQIKIDSGSAQFGTLVVTGNITHNLNRRNGEGSVRLELPNHKIPLPVDQVTFEVGSRIFWQDRGTGYEVRAEIKLTGGAEMAADGNILLEPMAGQPARLSGSINFQTKLGKGRLILMGNWKSPQWTVVYDR